MIGVDLINTEIKTELFKKKYAIDTTMDFYLNRNKIGGSPSLYNKYVGASRKTKGKVRIHNLVNFNKEPENSIKVSIVVPVCNVEEFLPECLESCINQTLKDIEIICVNDGSSDNSLEILLEYAKKDNRVKIIDKDNAGYGHTMNIGIDMASGEYIGIVESDDFVDLSMYEELYNIASKEGLDFIKSDFYRFEYDKSGQIKKRLDRVAARAPDLYNKVVNPREDTRVFHLVMQTWSGIYKKNFLVFNNIRHNETPGASYQDNGFWFQTFMYAYKVYFYDKAFYMNRRDNPNSSVYNRGKVYCMHEEYQNIEKILNEHPDLYDLFKYQYARKKFLNFLFTFSRIDQEFKYEYVFSIQEELQRAIKLSEIDWDEFDKRDKDHLKLILENPIEFFIKQSNVQKESDKKIRNLQKQLESSINKEKQYLLENKRLNNQLDKLNVERKQYTLEHKNLYSQLTVSNMEKKQYALDNKRLKNQVRLVSDEKNQCFKDMYDLLTSKSYLDYKEKYGPFEKVEKNDEENKSLNNVVHIAFITDENYAMPTTVAITSLKINKNESTIYKIHILANNVTKDSKSKFLMLEEDNFQIDIIPVTVDKKFSKLTKKDGDLHVSPSAIIKLRLPEILNKIGKVLYLDGDVLIQDDLLDLYNTDIKRYYAAVVKDILSERNHRHMVKMGINNKYYFNSGMMLLNLTKCRKQDMTNKLLDYRENGKNHFMDQDALNYVFNENVKYVSYKYNYLNKFYDWWGGEKLSLFYGEMFPNNKIDSYKEAVIIHLGSHEKPWKYDLGYLSELYREYYNKSPYKDEDLLLEELYVPQGQSLIKISDDESLTRDALVNQYLEDKEEKEFYEKEYYRLKNLYEGQELFIVNDELEKRERDIQNLTNSRSFKIGRAITKIPRTFKSLVKK